MTTGGQNTTGPDMTTGDDPTTGGTDNTTGSAGAVSHATDIQPIWDNLCVAACHDATGSGTLQTMLELSSDKAYMQLTTKNASQLASMPLVTPGDRQTSYLWHKIDGTQTDVGGGGVKMPLGKQITDEQKELVGKWIDDGAMP